MHLFTHVQANSPTLQPHAENYTAALQSHPPTPIHTHTRLQGLCSLRLVLSMVLPFSLQESSQQKSDKKVDTVCPEF